MMDLATLHLFSLGDSAIFLQTADNPEAGREQGQIYLAEMREKARLGSGSDPSPFRAGEFVRDCNPDELERAFVHLRQGFDSRDNEVMRAAEQRYGYPNPWQKISESRDAREEELAQENGVFCPICGHLVEADARDSLGIMCPDCGASRLEGWSGDEEDLEP